MEAKVESVAACKKKLTITIPREEIEAKLKERFDELEDEAQVPGFRPGRAPRRLVEKRFREAVQDEVRAKLVSESLTKAFEEQKLQVIGEPDVDPDAIQMPDDGPMTFSLDLEVRPEFELPDYTAIPIHVEQPTVGDADVNRALDRMREQYGKIEPVPEGGEARPNDIVTADLAIQMGEVLVLDHPNARLPVAAIAVEGIRLENIPDLLKGAKVGETRSATITIGQDAEKEDLRGKPAEVRLKLHEIRRISLPDDAALLQAADYETLDALKGALRRQLEGQSDAAYRDRQEDAVREWLLGAVRCDLPEDLAKRHANRLLERSVVDLQYRGVPVGELEKHIEQIRGASTERAAKDLKLFFILDAIAAKEKIETTDAEVDARLRIMAARHARREDRLREEMQADGSLDTLRGQIRDDKVVRLLLEKARVSEAGAAATADAAAAPGAAAAEGQVPAGPADAAAAPAAAVEGQAPAAAGAAAVAEGQAPAAPTETTAAPPQPPPAEGQTPAPGQAAPDAGPAGQVEST
jgi:trigger factor